MDFNYVIWDQSKTERMHTQFLKQVLGCNYQTPNIMARADTGCRPLINMILKRFILYIKSIKSREASLCHDVLTFETTNNETPNFLKFTENFSLDIENLILKSKGEISKICQGNYDRFWKRSILESSKATSFCKFKINIGLEAHLILKCNITYKKAISRFRMSNHTLMIEKGRHARIERNERKCLFCKNKLEDEAHFLLDCDLYTPQRIRLDSVCKEVCIRYGHYSNEQKFIFLMSSEDERVIIALGKYISESFSLRDKLVAYFFS